MKKQILTYLGNMIASFKEQDRLESLCVANSLKTFVEKLNDPIVESNFSFYEKRNIINSIGYAVQEEIFNEKTGFQLIKKVCEL